jgi:hypothetical protein
MSKLSPEEFNELVYTKCILMGGVFYTRSGKWTCTDEDPPWYMDWHSKLNAAYDFLADKGFIVEEDGSLRRE